MLPFPFYISRNQIDTNKTITKIGGQIPVAGMISYQNTLPYNDLLSGLYPPLHRKPGPQEELNNKNPFRREHILGEGVGKSAVLCKQKWHSWPQNNQAWATVAVFPITWATCPWLHLHSPTTRIQCLDCGGVRYSVWVWWANQWITEKLKGVNQAVLQKRCRKPSRVLKCKLIASFWTNLRDDVCEMSSSKFLLVSGFSWERMTLSAVLICLLCM